MEGKRYVSDFQGIPHTAPLSLCYNRLLTRFTVNGLTSMLEAVPFHVWSLPIVIWTVGRSH